MQTVSQAYICHGGERVRRCRLRHVILLLDERLSVGLHALQLLVRQDRAITQITLRTQVEILVFEISHSLSSLFQRLLSPGGDFLANAIAGDNGDCILLCHSQQGMWPCSKTMRPVRLVDRRWWRRDLRAWSVRHGLCHRMPKNAILTVVWYTPDTGGFAPDSGIGHFSRIADIPLVPRQRM